jgi:DHA3 family multidrug efflux protein-like MFS transporter
MRTFYQLLGAALVAVTTNNFVWFALTYWAYLTTKSVISTSIIAGIWLVTTALSANWFGSVVDRRKKKYVLLGSSITTLILFAAGYWFFRISPENAFTTVTSAGFWIFVIVLLFGVIAGSMYNIAIPTLVAFLVPEDRRDRANGLFGTVMGISFAITSAASGISLALGGMPFVLLVAIVFTLLAVIVVWLIHIPEKDIIPDTSGNPRKSGFRGTIQTVSAIPGLFALILFTTFNNFLGGVFFSLMDAYGLTLVTVQAWGFLWGILSLGFILGGLFIAKKGLGANLLRNLFRINIVLWIISIFFTIQASIILLAVGLLIYIFFIPFVEAIEQTIFQTVVPKERLGRAFGLAHSIEQAASPITAFFVGPITQFIFIPFMTTGRGVDLIGSWFGVGPGRGIALVFILAGFIGLAVTLVVMRSRPYKLLAARYNELKHNNDTSSKVINERAEEQRKMRTLFFFKLIPPRLTFPGDMTRAEDVVMQKHYAYWKQLAAESKVVLFGTVMDPNGSYSMAIIEADREETARNMVENDPAVKSNAGFRSELYPVSDAVVSQRKESVTLK